MPYWVEKPATTWGTPAVDEAITGGTQEEQAGTPAVDQVGGPETTEERELEGAAR